MSAAISKNSSVTTNWSVKAEDEDEEDAKDDWDENDDEGGSGILEGVTKGRNTVEGEIDLSAVRSGSDCPYSPPSVVKAIAVGAACVGWGTLATR